MIGRQKEKYGWEFLFIGANIDAVETARHYGINEDRASLLYSNGVNLRDIQEWLGHSDISTTLNIYTHLDFSSKVDSANAILGHFPKL